MSDDEKKKSTLNPSKLEEKIITDSKSDEMEEFYLKVQVDLEHALSQGEDYLHILDEVYSQSHQTKATEVEQFKKFGMAGSQQIDEILMVTCFKDSGEPLFDICLSEQTRCKTSLTFILNAIKNYVKYKLGEIIEELSLESQTIHFFLIKKTYIVAVVTTKEIPRDKIWGLAIQVVNHVTQHHEATLSQNTEFMDSINKVIKNVQASLVQERHTLKIILIGDGAVGKTSIRRQYLGEGFRSDYQMTIGADLAIKESPVLYSGGRQVKYLIWDLAGQPRFESVRKAYYMSAMGALAVFDLTRIESFQNIVAWMNEFWKNNGRGPVPLIILGNKADLREQDPQHVSDHKASQFATALSRVAKQYRGFNIHFLSTSAKTGLNIDLAFELLGEAILNYFATTKK